MTRQITKKKVDENDVEMKVRSFRYQQFRHRHLEKKQTHIITFHLTTRMRKFEKEMSLFRTFSHFNTVVVVGIIVCFNLSIH